MRSADFRWFFAAGAIDTLGSSIAPVALAFGVLDVFGSVTSLGIVLAARSVTNVVWLLFGGVLADRMPRTLVLTGSCLASGITQAAVAVVIFTRTDSLVLLAVLSAVNGLCSAFASPALTGLLPQTVPAAELGRANALSRLGTNTAATIGLAVAGVIAATLGSGWGLVIDAATFVVAAGCFAALSQGRADVVGYRNTVLTDLVEGWRAFSSRAWLWMTVIVFCVANLVYFGGLTVLGPAIADESFGRAKWGLLLAAQTVGYVLGGMLALRVTTTRLLPYGLVCCLPLAAPLIALGARAPYALLLAASFVAGVGVEQLGVAWQTCMQHHVPGNLLSRVSSYDYLGSFLALPVGEVVAGPISQSIGKGSTLIGGGTLLLVVLALALMHPQVRSLRTRLTSDVTPETV